jgi:hypothetical protein
LNFIYEMNGDLLRKMSKKIAQLTKVIFQLYTKQDDHEIEIIDLKNKHEIEINLVFFFLFNYFW